MSNTPKIKLLVRADYRCREINYHRGETIDVTKERASYLFRDAPDAFEVFDPESPEHAVEIAAAIPPETEQDRIDQERANRFWDAAVKASPDRSKPGATHNTNPE